MTSYNTLYLLAITGESNHGKVLLCSNKVMGLNLKLGLPAEIASFIKQREGFELGGLEHQSFYTKIKH